MNGAKRGYEFESADAMLVPDPLAFARSTGLAPGLFGEDDEGYGRVLDDDGKVPRDQEQDVRLAVANCPEYAVQLLEEG